MFNEYPSGLSHCITEHSELIDSMVRISVLEPMLSTRQVQHQENLSKSGRLPSSSENELTSRSRPTLHPLSFQYHTT